MRASASALLAILLLGASPAPGVYIGEQALLLTGAHTDVGGTQHGVAGGAILQLGVQAKRTELHIEGIPPVSLPQAPSAFYGQATPQLSLLNGALRAAVDANAHWWLGAGATIINQRTPLPNLDQTAGSRLAGVRVEAMYRAQLGGSHFLEFDVGAAPRLSGVDKYTYGDGQQEVDKPEVASEEDGMFAFGVQRAHSELLFGLRTINFSARFMRTGQAADRNNGAGILVEWRQFVH